MPSSLLEVIAARPELLGIGIDENTAIVVRRDAFEVIGQGYVAIYDSQRMVGDRGQFHFLAPGNRYALASRVPLRRARDGFLPIQGIEETPWPNRQ